MPQLLVWHTQFTNQSKPFDLLRLLFVDREEDAKKIFFIDNRDICLHVGKLTAVHHSLKMLKTGVVAYKIVGFKSMIILVVDVNLKFSSLFFSLLLFKVRSVLSLIRS